MAGQASKACVHAAALTGASIPTLERDSLLRGGKIVRREQEQMACTCSESDSRRHTTPSQTVGYNMP